jgi:UDP-glucose 4-epimerase
MKMWPLSRVAFWLGKQPIIGPLLAPLFSTRNNQVVIIPVNEAIQPPGSEVLPYNLLRQLIEGASAHFIMDKCMCRDNEDCQTYPHDIGCLYLGEGAVQISPYLGCSVSVDEALAHMEYAMQKGLVPLIAHTTFDAYLLDIPYERMLTVCFCCDCCCIVQRGLRMGPPAFWDIVTRLPGLSIEVGEECMGCEICLGVCPVGAIGMVHGRAATNEQCKGCGRCTEVCPVEAIHIRVAPEVDIFNHLQRHINEFTDIG